MSDGNLNSKAATGPDAGRGRWGTISAGPRLRSDMWSSRLKVPALAPALYRAPTSRYLRYLHQYLEGSQESVCGDAGVAVAQRSGVLSPTQGPCFLRPIHSRNSIQESFRFERWRWTTDRCEDCCSLAVAITTGRLLLAGLLGLRTSLVLASAAWFA